MEKNELTQYLLRMHQIINIQDYNNAMIAGQHIMELVNDHNVSFPEIESALREMNSRVYLIGLPMYFFQGEYKLQSKLPRSSEIFEYVLWIELNGKEKFKEFLDKNNFTSIDKTLKKTGFLMLDPDKKGKIK